ncbi:MAG: MSMEG_1061 family FMN-dependent PPOX-type flavoprotein [Pseudomonadota bacterium]
MDGEAGAEGKVELRALYGEPSGLAVVKQIDHIDPHCRHFIGLSPFLCLGSADSEGRQDVSPRGDMPGFVQVLDDHTLAIPDRPGNNRLDSLSNLQINPNVALIFLVPGVDETLRVNGLASLSTDPALLASMAVNGKAPKAAIKVAVREVYFHCGKALKRSKLWGPREPGAAHRAAVAGAHHPRADQVDRDDRRASRGPHREGLPRESLVARRPDFQ